MSKPVERFVKTKKAARKVEARVSNRSRLFRKDVVNCRLRELRTQYGLTIREAAQQVGMSQAGWHAVENGGNVTMKIALDICAFYGVSLGEIWTAKEPIK